MEMYFKAISSSSSNSVCAVVFRCFPGDADAAFPGAVAGGSGWLGGSTSCDRAPADPPETSLRHHQHPGGHQPPREAVGQQVQVDVSEQMKIYKVRIQDALLCFYCACLLLYFGALGTHYSLIFPFTPEPD